MTLTPEERDLIKRMIDRGEPLPDDYRFRLFREPREAELIWPGKTHEVTQAVLPFQSIEQIDEPRVESDVGAFGTGDLFSVGQGGRQAAGWSNKLIWGDNKLVLSSLKGGPLRKQIEDAGGLKLVYIDPPFDVGADFSYELDVGDGDRLQKEPSILEDVAYRDTWGRGLDSYASMIRERLYLIEAMLSNDATIYCHVGRNVSHIVRHVMDEIFGNDNFINEITWKRSHAHGDTGQGAIHFGRVTEAILVYSRGSPTWNPRYSSYTSEILDRDYKYVDPKNGERYRHMPVDGPGGASKGNPFYEFLGVKGYWRYSQTRMQELYDAGEIVLSSTGKSLSRKKYLRDAKGTPVTDLWDDVNRISPTSSERLDYPTQKPEALLERIIAASSNEGDLIADFFCGSGTTLAVAEKLGRRWIGADLGRFSIHTSRKRMIGVQRQLKSEGKRYRSFEILNLGKYERQWFVGVDPNLPEDQRRAVSADKEARYLSLILQSYQAQAVDQTPPFHGTKQGSFVLVGPVDAPVTEGQVAEAVEAARRMNISRIDVLGFEFEMGLSPRAVDEARAKGVAVALRAIPKDVFDRRAVEKGQVTFHDLAYVEAKAEVVSKKDRSVTISLTNFGVNYRQEDVDALVAGLGKNKSKVTVDGGQVVKITTDKEGVATREVLTKEWTDWIDYWAVDFDYHSRPETIIETITLPDGAAKHVPQWTGGYIFENEWQSFRTKRDRKLELTSASHTYERLGRHVVAIKVIDIFGNDTTKVFGVEV
jgi:DNA modification methylase